MNKLRIVGVALLLVGVTSAQLTKQQQDENRNAAILRYENINNGDGSYQYNYETSNGIAVEESGYLKNPGAENPIQTVRGSYQYISPEGQLIKIVYIADENGFQAQGDHLPTPPPIPPEIQKSLDIIYANVAKQQAAGIDPSQNQGGYNQNQGGYNQNRNQNQNQNQNNQRPSFTNTPPRRY